MKKLLSIALLISLGTLNIWASEVQKESFLDKAKRKASELKESAKSTAKKISTSAKQAVSSDVSRAKKLLKEFKANTDPRSQTKQYNEIMKLKSDDAAIEKAYAQIRSEAKTYWHATAAQSDKYLEGEAAKEKQRRKVAQQAEDERQAKILGETLRKENQAKREENERIRRESEEMGRKRMAAGQEEEQKEDPEFLAKYNELKKQRNKVQMDVLNGNSRSGRNFNALVDIAMDKYRSPSQEKALRALAVGGV